MALVDRAANAGYDTLLVTVDVPVAGARLRDKRNGFTIPPQLTVSTILDALTRPAWWFNFLTTEPLAFASLSRWPGTVAELLDTMFGARFTMVGRACLYGLMAGGRAGVDCMIAVLRSDIERTMRLLGAASLEELAPHHVTLPGH